MKLTDNHIDFQVAILNTDLRFILDYALVWC